MTKSVRRRLARSGFGLPTRMRLDSRSWKSWLTSGGRERVCKIGGAKRPSRWLSTGARITQQIWKKPLLQAACKARTRRTKNGTQTGKNSKLTGGAMNSPTTKPDSLQQSANTETWKAANTTGLSSGAIAGGPLTNQAKSGLNPRLTSGGAKPTGTVGERRSTAVGLD
eukprot:Gregarina_sp_Pseudo_9__5417@NODE_66_length_4628_cov_5_444105_g61_i0_p6_GENE_NODE_66_length_4628_cov_5_444105_g61_i0NODE_66_length_4628_cov_5_444105_g61_i0_p6_ORF_typecomplete_len168_score8_07Podoplanin/PF05808_11/0_056_NODE_66_length_4628_cov_5_444105_g61_i013181821